LTAIDLYKDPSIIAKAREEFLQKRGPDFKYATRVGDSKPPINFRKQ
jgi:aminobenzoyl-glutamate utilization protein B